MFGEKAAKGGFRTIEVFDRRSMTLDELVVYPLFTAEFLAINLIVDLLYALIDPRIRTPAQGAA